MNIAIVHDSLVEYGGAERVLAAVLEMYPDADVYTAVSSKKFIRTYFPSCRVISANIFGDFFQFHSSLFQSVSPFVWRSFRLNSYDLVLSISGHLMSNLVHPSGPVCVQYILTPPKNIFSIDPKTKFQKIFPYEYYLRGVYERQLRSTPHVLTLSHHMQNELRRLFRVRSDVIYPPVKLPRISRLQHSDHGYYLIVSRLDRSKSIELAIAACNMLRKRLVIVGVSNEPSYDRYLHAIAGPTVEFTGFVPDADIAAYYAHAKAFLFTPANEDFGIAPVEALARGVPVIAFNGGGAAETVSNGISGLLFPQHSAESLMRAIRQLDRRKIDRNVLMQQAAAFGAGRFKKELQRYLRDALKR